MKEFEVFTEIAKNIKLETETANISKAEIARRVGLSPSTISGYCSGYSFPNLYILRKLCHVLDCTYEDILGKPIPNED